MEAGRPSVACGRIAPGLEDRRDALLLDDSAGGEEIAAALSELRGDPANAEALGESGRRRLRDHHAWTGIADQTLAFAKQVMSERVPEKGSGTQAPTSS